MKAACKHIQSSVHTYTLLTIPKSGVKKNMFSARAAGCTAADQRDMVKGHATVKHEGSLKGRLPTPEV